MNNPDNYSLLLSPQEKDRFMVWCRHQAETAREMVKVMEENSMPEVIINLEKTRVMAYGFVASEIDKTESFTVKP